MTNDAGGPIDDSFPRDEDAYWEFMDGPRDEFICESCGSTAFRAHRGGEPGAFYAEVDGKPAVVCHQCDDNYDWETIETRIRERRSATHHSPLGAWAARYRSALRPVSNRIPVPLSVHDISPERRASLVPETTVFLGRFAAIVVFTAIILASIAIFAALAGALFVSPATGVQWFSITANSYLQWGLFIVARPSLVLGVVGLGYLAHLVEYHRHIGSVDQASGRKRPRWHFVAFFAGAGLTGWIVWVLSYFDIVGPVVLPVGVLAWSAGAFALVYFLHETLLEDRLQYGLRIHPPIWKFPTQYAVGLMLYDGVVGLPGPESNAFSVAIVPPVVGLLYAARRYVAFTERGAVIGHRIRAVAYRWRQVIPSPTLTRRQGGFAETNQFGHVDATPETEPDGDAAGRSSLDKQQELEQTREWASYLESELHEREEQMQDLEARLAQVRQELQESREPDSTSGSTVDERDDLLTDLFDIRDNFRRALDAESVLDDDAAADLSDGIELIDSQIRSILEREGVEEIDTSGEADPTKHRVVKTVPTADAEPGEIVDVYQLGYRQGDRIIREAQVVVAEEPPADEAAGPNDDGSRINRGDDAA